MTANGACNTAGVSYQIPVYPSATWVEQNQSSSCSAAGIILVQYWPVSICLAQYSGSSSSWSQYVLDSPDGDATTVQVCTYADAACSTGASCSPSFVINQCTSPYADGVFSISSRGTEPPNTGGTGGTTTQTGGSDPDGSTATPLGSSTGTSSAPHVASATILTNYAATAALVVLLGLLRS
jgi:hypothetical protein